MTRPGAEEVGRYRRHVDGEVQALLADGPGEQVATLVELGVNHEQQHQELLVMDASTCSRGTLSGRLWSSGRRRRTSPRLC